jgi:hypothetical protein
MNGPPRVWFKGERCKLTAPSGKCEPAEVVSASPNGMSVCLRFEAIMDGWAELAPLLWREEAGSFSDLAGCEGWKLEDVRPGLIT